MNALHRIMTAAGRAPVAPFQRYLPLAATDSGISNAARGGSVRHVLRAIASEPAFDRCQWLERVRPLVEKEQAALRARFEADGCVETFLRCRSRLADGVVLGLLSLARAAVRGGAVTMLAPVTVVATGGYGRRELAPASDLNLLFLRPDLPRQREHAERVLGFVLAGLWDVGFTVAHATRTLPEVRALADAEPVMVARLLDARFLAGRFNLYNLLEAEVQSLAGGGSARELAGSLTTGLQRRSLSRGDNEAEPNVKHGRGGLCDMERLQWLIKLGHVGGGCGAWSVAAAESLALVPGLLGAHRFLWQVRTHLHLIAGRAQERLRRDLQPLVAARLGLGGGQPGADALLHVYRRHTRSVRELLEVV